MTACFLQSYSFSVSSNKGFLDTMNEIDPRGSLFTTFLILLMMIPIVLLFVLIRLKKRNANLIGENDLQTCSQITVIAKVISKRDLQPGGNLADPYSHIIFECEDGQRMDFAFKANDTKYHSIVIGDAGSLTYAGKAFVDFQRIINR